MSLTAARQRVLEPIERISEVLFGLIMVLTFTGSLSVAESGRAEVRDMLVGALGCNLAWGVIDAIMYLMARLVEHAQGGRRPSLARDDWRGALGVFLLVFVSTLPVVLPFAFMQDAFRAMRVSNLIAVSLLFLTGFSFGRAIGYHKWLTGFAMVVLGLVLVAATIALGG